MRHATATPVCPRPGPSPGRALGLSLLLLAAGSGIARADSPATERFDLRPGEIEAELLKAAIGIATLSVGAGKDGGQDQVQTYRRTGNFFVPSRLISLAGTRPVSSWVAGSDGVARAIRPSFARRYLVLERKESYVRVALDPAGHRAEWFRRTPEGSFPKSVEFVDFGDAGTYRCYQVDPFVFGSGDRKVYDKPDRSGGFRVISSGRGKSFLAADLIPLQRKGDLFEVAAMHDLNEPRIALGWIELKDEAGRLTLWFSPGPDC